MNIRIEILASVIALIVSIGTIFYQAVSIKKDVEVITSAFNKNDQAIENGLKKIHDIEINFEKLSINSDFYNKKLEEINIKVTEIQKSILSSSEHTNEMLMKILENRRP